jgi:regulation of enolase protein 1 (concanavalin A-like superfamily)
MELRLPTVPGILRWQNQPLDWQILPDNSLVITAGANTDWFVDPALTPAGVKVKDNAPVALFTAPDKTFTLSAKVSVDFAGTFDAGVLQVRAGDSLWAKLCFEYSPQHQPMIVSVVTRDVSDDCNSRPIDGREIYLRILRRTDIFAFHYSQDGRFWHLVRYFSLGPLNEVQAGFSSQSPSGSSCRALFSEIHYRARAVMDIRSGE